MIIYLFLLLFVCRYSCINRPFNKRRKLVRKLDKDSIESLKNELSLMDWENIMNETDVDKSYDMFLDVFTKMYDKHCPLKKMLLKEIKKANPGLQMV